MTIGKNMNFVAVAGQLTGPDPKRKTILKKLHPHVSEAVVDIVACFKTVAACARAIDACMPEGKKAKSAEVRLNSTMRALSKFLNGQVSGLTQGREPNRILRGLAILGKKPVHELVDVQNYDKLYREYYGRYPFAPRFLLQLVALHKTLTGLATKLIVVEPYSESNIPLATIVASLSNYLRGASDGMIMGRRQPGLLIQAMSHYTGLDLRYFIRPGEGGLTIYPSQRLSYDETSGIYMIVDDRRKPAIAEDRRATL